MSEFAFRFMSQYYDSENNRTRFEGSFGCAGEIE